MLKVKSIDVLDINEDEKQLTVKFDDHNWFSINFKYNAETNYYEVKATKEFIEDIQELLGK